LRYFARCGIVCALFTLSTVIGLRAVAAVQNADPTVYVTKTGTKYHRDECGSLSRSKVPMKLSEAAGRYGACSVCKPPVPQQGASPAPRPSQPKDSDDPIVYVTKTGSKYHKAGCRSLSKSAIPMKLSEASKRYGACSVCKPPVPRTIASLERTDDSRSAAQSHGNVTS